jgi:fumarate hydratase class II
MNDRTHPQPHDIPIGIRATGTRRETDSMGEIEVPADRYWGAQTQRTSAIAHKTNDEDLTLKEAALKSGYIDEKRFDEIVDPKKMVGPSDGGG